MYICDKEKNIHLLFIHIPKTGGTSLEKYFSKKYGVVLNKDSFYCEHSRDFINDVSLQHQLYCDLKLLTEKIKIDENIKIITIVRNPYQRIMSELFSKKKINKNTDKEKVNEEIRLNIEEYKNNKRTRDNHIRPQVDFLYEDTENCKLIENLIILKTEKLTEGMKSIGYEDFNHHDNNSCVDKNYIEFLNEDSIRLINEVYDADFRHLGYEKINI